MRIASSILAVGLSIAAAAGSAQAAGPSRVWVSGKGADQVGCGAPVSPCRSLQFAVDSAAVGGEIDILDPAGYGAVSITKPISIVNDGVGTAGVQAASGDAITIDVGSAATDFVYLRGLNIDGVHGSATNGVQVISGGYVEIVNCVVRHFANDGLLDATSTGGVVQLANSVLSDNGGDGIEFVPTSVNAAITLDRVTAQNNSVGMAAATDSHGSATILNLTASGNVTGLSISSHTAQPTLLVYVDASSLTNSLQTSLLVSGSPLVFLSRNLVALGRVTALDDSLATPGLIQSSGDNHIGDITGTVPTIVPSVIH